MIFFSTTLFVFFFAFIGVPILLGFARLFGVYAIVHECHANVYVLFGKVLGVLDEPGLHFPISKFGPRALLVRFFGNVRDVDMGLNQKYLRSQPVNTRVSIRRCSSAWACSVRNPDLRRAGAAA